MSRRVTNNLWAALIVVCVLALILTLSGCAGIFGGKGIDFHLETDNSKCGTKTVDFSTDYQVKSLKIERTIEGGGSQTDGEGCGGGYTVQLDEVTTKDAEMGLILELVNMIRQMAGFPTSPPPANDP